MNTSVELNLKSSFLQRFFLLLTKKTVSVPKLSAVEATKKEIDALWYIIKDQKAEENHISNLDCSKKIVESFNRLKVNFSDEELDNAHTWIRYVKFAVQCEISPIEELVKHVSADNYIILTRRLSDLSKSIDKGKDENVIKIMEKFYEMVCCHIINNINFMDVPSCLFLGRTAQKQKNYAEARMWFSRVVETDNPFNGLTALLACYEDEIKTLLSSNRKRVAPDTTALEKVHELNERQAAIYEKWYAIMKNRIDDGENITEDFKKKYVSILTGYSRFERNRDNCEKAFELLKEVPIAFPDIYRIYSEEAMIYQFRSQNNPYYSLNKAIETFHKAYVALSEGKTTDASNAKSKKSILMPLANTYFQSSQYDEAKKICDKVLEIDDKEQKAIRLKHQIMEVLY